MWGLFQPRCPLETQEKAWTESRMNWLAQTFGIARLREAEVILPGPEHFPDGFDGTDATAERIFARICDWMKVDRDRVELVITDDAKMDPGAAGLYESQERWRRSRIRVIRSQMADPQAMVATMAHELAHEILLGGGHLDPSVSDHEWVTDLLMVFLGIGIFAANTRVRDRTDRQGNVSWWSIEKLGYLPARMLGYGMALFAFARGERRPEWARDLAQDARTALTDGIRFLEKTGDTLFQPDSSGPAESWIPNDEIRNRLKNRSPSMRLSALWDVGEPGSRPDEVLHDIASLIRDRDSAIAAEAIRVVSAFGERAVRCADDIRHALRAEDAGIRYCACTALGILKADAAADSLELSDLLRDPVRRVHVAAATALANLGAPLEQRAARRLVNLLETAIIQCEFTTADALSAAAAKLIPLESDLLESSLEGRARDERVAILSAIERQTPSVPRDKSHATDRGHRSN